MKRKMKIGRGPRPIFYRNEHCRQNVGKANCMWTFGLWAFSEKRRVQPGRCAGLAQRTGATKR